MNRIFLRIAISVAVILGPVAANAQIKGLLRDKAIETLSKSKRGDEKKEEPQQTQEPEQNEQQPSKSGPNFLERKMMNAMGLNNVKYEQQYDFSSSMMMEIESVDSLNNTEKVLYTTYFNPANKSYALVFDAVDRQTGQKQKSTIIFDTKNWAMLILGDNQDGRSGIAMVVAPDSSLIAPQETETTEEKVDENFIHPWYTPTGNSKMIQGYNCKEYTYMNPEGSVDLWVTNDQKLNFSNAYTYMNGFQALASGGWAYGMGMVMEMVFRDANSPARTHMLIKEILPDSPKKLDISSYNVIGMGGEKK